MPFAGMVFSESDCFGHNPVLFQHVYKWRFACSAIPTPIILSEQRAFRVCLQWGYVGPAVGLGVEDFSLIGRASVLMNIRQQ